MRSNIIELTRNLALLGTLCVIPGFIRQGRERRVWLSPKLLFTAHLCMAFLFTFCSLATAGITAPKTTPRESIRVVMDDNYPPYSFRDASGTLQGILVDQWALWEKKTGIQVRLDAMDWAKAQQRMEVGDYDVIDTLFVNEHRKTLYDFSAPYANIEVPLFFSRELSGIRGPKDLQGFVVGAKRGDSAIEILKASGVLNFLLFDNYEAIVAAARDGKIKVFTIDKPPAMYFLIKMGIQDRFRESEPLYSGEFHRAVRKGNTVLLEDVQQGFNAISKGEYEGIDRRWYGAPIFTKTTLAFVAVIAGGAAVIVCLLLLWVGLLRRSVRQRTAELQTDITERKLTEETLRDSEAQNRALIHAIPDLIFMHDRDGNYLAVHAPDPNLLILPSKTLLHRSLNDVLPDATAQQFIQAIGNALESGAMQEVTYSLTLEGAEKHFEARVSPCTDDTVITLVRDVTDRKRDDQALLDTMQRLQLATASAHMGVWDWDLRAGTMTWDDRMFELYGATRVKIQGTVQDWKDGLHPEDLNRAIAECEAALRGEAPFDTEFRVKHKDGTILWIKANGLVIRDERGNPIRMLGLNRDVTERVNFETALAESGEAYRTSFKQAAIGIVHVSPKGLFLKANPRFSEFTGYSEEGLLGKSYLEITHPEDQEQSLDYVQGILEGTGKPGSVEKRYLHRDGHVIWGETNVSVVRNPDGTPRYLLAMIQDITERKQAEMALRETNELLALFFHHSPIYIYIKEVTPTESRVLQTSENYKQMFGVKDSEIVGKTMTELYPADFAAKTLVDDLAVVAGGKTLEVEEELNGRSYTTLKFPIVQGGKTLLAGFTIDITEQKKTKVALAAQSIALAAVIDNNPMSIQILDSEGRTIRTNPAFLALFGALPPPSYSMFSDSTLAAQGLSPVFDQIRAGEVVYFPETAYNVHDLFPENPDIPVWVRALGFPILGANGRPERYVLVHEDISQRRKAEEEKVKLQAQLLQAQKMEGLGSLAGGVAHDMNNVLGAILGMASANIATQPVGSPVYRAFDTISQAAIRGGKMVKSLLNFARQSPIEEQELDMNAILREEVNLLERTTLNKIRLEVDFALELRPILGDANALTHAFMNLCVNAVDAMPENGTLTLRTRNVDNDWIEVLVKDTGTGMSKEVLEKAMDPFYTTKEMGKGTGLGLSMVYSTVMAHQGQIEIQSELGKGTRVRIRFPACEPRIHPPESAAEPQAAPAQGKLNVLVVDDDELIQSTMQEVLEVLGHTVVTTSSGEEALAKLEAGFEPDAVILDMNMPGLGGTGTLPRLRALRPTVPVLLSTGRADEAALNLIKAHPHVTLLSKPFSMKELQQHLERLGRG